MTQLGPQIFGLLLGDDGSFGEGRAELTAYSFRQPIPEPATWGLMLLGIGMVGTAAMRQRMS